MSHVVAEFDASGVQTAYYLRALDDLIAVIRPTGTRYYHADGIGSIRKLTDETGTVTDSYEYTAFGEQYEHVGTDPQPYSFTGEPLAPNTGFQYHRARWMQPSTGRFAGIDPFEGLDEQPGTLHRYIYSRGNVPNRVDPSGLFDLSECASIGRAVHTAVSFHYQLLGATIDRAVCQGNRKRPDIRFHEDADRFFETAGEIYEIKPIASARVAAREVLWYRQQLALAYPEIDWRPGFVVPPLPSVYMLGQLVHPLLLGRSVRVGLTGQMDGVITYEIVQSPIGLFTTVWASSLVTASLLQMTTTLSFVTRF